MSFTNSILARTGAEKRALAAELRKNNPEALKDLKDLAEAFGPLEEVEMELSDPEAKMQAGHTHE